MNKIKKNPKECGYPNCNSRFICELYHINGKYSVDDRDCELAQNQITADSEPEQTF